MIQIFANRAELMPVGETTEEHKQWQDEEAALVEKDRSSTDGLFRGCFKILARRPMTLAAPIRDDEDNVDRCPRCTWELEDGQCGSCGYPFEGGGSSDSEGAEYYHPDEIYDMEHRIDMDDALFENLAEEANAHESYGEHRDSDAEDDDYSPRSYIRHRVSNVLRPRLQSNDYDSLPDTEEGSGDDDEEVDSVDSFVVADEEVPPSTASSNRSGSPSYASSPRSLNWEIENRTAIGDIQESDDDHESQQNSEASEHEASSPLSHIDREDESDEGPVPLSRRQLFRFSSDSDESASTESSQAVATIIQDRVRRRRTPRAASGIARQKGNIAHRNRERGHSNGASGIIEIESDSEPPIPTQRRRRRRAIQTRLSSDEETNAEASSGTATVGRQSPRLGSRTQPNERLQGSQARNTSSPAVIASSSTRSSNMEDEEPDHPHVPTAFPPSRPFSERPQSALLAISPHSPHESYERTRRPPTDASHSTYSLPRNYPTLDHSAYPGRPSVNQQRRRNRPYGLPRPRHGRNSPAARLSHSPMRSEGRTGQSARDRRAQKIEKRAERERLKAEREQRSSA